MGNWVERRADLDFAMPELWNLLCIEMEQALESFEKRYGRDRQATISHRRIENCFHLVAKSWNEVSRERSIDICLDLKGRAVFSRSGGAELARLLFGLDAAGLPCLLRPDGSPATLDEASRLFLEPFIFPAR